MSDDGAGADVGWRLTAESLRLAYERLQARVPGLVITAAGGCFPFQAEGRLHGLRLYFRYRHCDARLQLGDDLFAPLYMAATDYGEDDNGILEAEEFEALMLQLVPQLRRAPRLWEFAGVETTDTAKGPKAGDSCTYGAWGHTPEEAWARLTAYPTHPMLAEYFTPETWAALLAARQMDPQAVTADDRVWPDPEPIFTVLPSEAI